MSNCRIRSLSISWMILILAAFFSPLLAQERPNSSKRGPVIEAFGPVFEVPDLDFPTPRQDIYRVIFDISQSPEDKMRMNPRLETLARFLNMHARQGIPVEHMRLVAVLHGGAGKDALRSEAYQSRYGVPNPNQPLLEALKGAGVEIFLCGQTAESRGLPKAELHNSVRLALSAMTVLVAYQNDGYRLIAF